jgi:hypothetical protein
MCVPRYLAVSSGNVSLGATRGHLAVQDVDELGRWSSGSPTICRIVVLNAATSSRVGATLTFAPLVQPPSGTVPGEQIEGGRGRRCDRDILPRKPELGHAELKVVGDGSLT